MKTLVALVMTIAVAHAASPTPEQKCQKGRFSAAGKYAQCQDNAMAKFFARGDAGAMETALSKCRVKYTDTWAKLVKQAAGTGASCESTRFIDNGDTSVTDNLTGLQWNQKDELGGGNDKDATITWLNANYYYAGTNYISPFDWRLPTRAELQTILSEPFTCTTSPCIDPIFGPTAGDYYWTSSVDPIDPSLAWVVNFGTGNVGNASKTDTWHVRAVRGGL